MKEELLKKINNKTIKAGVIGLGYVGLPLAVEIANSGFNTIGFDVQEVKTKKVNNKENYISDVQDEILKKVIDNKNLMATTDFSKIEELDFIAICVPTPLDKYQQPDVSYIVNSAKEIGKYLKSGTMIVLESTTYPGTTEEVVKPILEELSNLKCNKDFYLAFSPERVDPGNEIYKTKNTPKIIGGLGNDANECISKMYESFLESKIITVSSPRQMNLNGS